MATRTIDTLVIGAGQAGVATSEHLSKGGVPHLVLERGRIAEHWRSRRWDSLVANGPAWHDRFPGMDYPTTRADAFPDKDSVASYFEDYVRMIDAPVECGVEVTALTRLDHRPGFRATTSTGEVEAARVVVATGPFQKPTIPAIVPPTDDLTQIHSADYRNPDQLPAGAVLVVGGGASGVQIADELCRSGRRVFLSVGPHDRPPRAYRGLDYCWWLGVLGKWDIAAPRPGTEHVSIAVSGAHGGHTVDFRNLAWQGITLVGRTESFDGKSLHFSQDLAANIARGDANYLSVLDEADAYAAANGLDLPEEPEARVFAPDPDCVTQPLGSVDLRAEGIAAIVWATGYDLDFGWIDIDVFDDRGRPRHQRGVTPVQGLYFVGLPWLSRRGSSFIWGVWHDARHIADQIGIQRSYAAYQAGRAEG